MQNPSMTDREKRLQGIIESLREILEVPFRKDVIEHAREIMAKLKKAENKCSPPTS